MLPEEKNVEVRSSATLNNEYFKKGKWHDLELEYSAVIDRRFYEDMGDIGRTHIDIFIKRYLNKKIA